MNSELPPRMHDQAQENLFVGLAFHLLGMTAAGVVCGGAYEIQANPLCKIRSGGGKKVA